MTNNVQLNDIKVMKKLMLALCLSLGGVALVNAQDTTQTQSQTQTQMSTDQDQNRQQIEVSALPEAIRTSLQTQDYSGWTVSAAYTADQTASTGDDAASTSSSSSNSSSTNSSSSTSTD